MHYQVVLAVIVSAFIAFASAEESDEKNNVGYMPLGSDEFSAYNNFYGADDRSKKGNLI